MRSFAPADGVSLTRAMTLAQLEGSLDSLAHQPRFDIACNLEERGRAYFYDTVHQCAYYLCSQDADVLVWTWKPVETWWEAAILRSLIEARDEPLDEVTALEFRRRATNRRPDWLIAQRRYRRALPAVPFVTNLLILSEPARTKAANALHACVLLIRRCLPGRVGSQLIRPVLPAGEAASGG